jgi:sulfate adenylyltransferase subunit 2
MSNWTELDIWQYIHLREHRRSCPCTSRRRAPGGRRVTGTLIMVDDERMPLYPGENAG